MRKLLFIFIIIFLLIGTSVWAQWGFPGGDDPFKALDNASKSKEINFEDDYYLGRAVAANIIKSYPVYNGNPNLTNYLNRICQALVINSPKQVVFNGYHVAVLNTSQYNAFATPGGHILVTRGLLEVTKSEDELAALIAHELAHINLRHAANIIDNMSITSLADEMALKGAALAGNSAGAQRLLTVRNSVAPVADQMMKNGFSQEQEFEADKKALEILNNAGYDPRALLEVLQILQTVQSKQSGGFNSTHPTPRDRISRVNVQLNSYRPNTTLSVRKSRFINK
jgi:predicted Zn-dependent protease